MKALIALMIFSLSTQAVFATTYLFDCGNPFNIPRLARIESKDPGQDGYTLAAKYSTSGKDQTTGTIEAKTYDMLGQTDYSSDLTGEEIAVIALSKADNPGYQVIIARTERVGDTVLAAQINIAGNEIIKFNCLLESFVP